MWGSLMAQQVKNPLMQETKETTGLTSGQRFLKEKNGKPAAYSCLKNHMNKGACHAMVCRVIKS